jgi:hypothetical protein
MPLERTAANLTKADAPSGALEICYKAQRIAGTEETNP